jgi:hypothetical protein
MSRRLSWPTLNKLGSRGLPSFDVTEPETSYRDAASLWATIVLNQWFDGCQGRAATQSTPGRAWTATAPPCKPGRYCEGMSCHLTVVIV